MFSQCAANTTRFSSWPSPYRVLGISCPTCPMAENHVRPVAPGTAMPYNASLSYLAKDCWKFGSPACKKDWSIVSTRRALKCVDCHGSSPYATIIPIMLVMRRDRSALTALPGVVGPLEPPGCPGFHVVWSRPCRRVVTTVSIRLSQHTTSNKQPSFRHRFAR